MAKAAKKTRPYQSRQTRPLPIPPRPIPLSACSDGPQINPMHFRGGAEIPHYDFQRPDSAAPMGVLDVAPLEMVDLPSFFLQLSEAQLRRSWKLVTLNALIEELESRGLLMRKEARGLARHFLLALEVVHDRFVRLDPATRPRPAPPRPGRPA